MTVDPPIRTDAELLEATFAGDEEAFLEIYRRYRDRVHRFAYRMTASAEVAHDITHICFASLLPGCESDSWRRGCGVRRRRRPRPAS